MKLHLFYMAGGEERTEVVPDALPVIVLGEVDAVVHVAIQTEVLRQTAKNWLKW